MEAAVIAHATALANKLSDCIARHSRSEDEEREPLAVTDKVILMQETDEIPKDCVGIVQATTDLGRLQRVRAQWQNGVISEHLSDEVQKRREIDHTGSVVANRYGDLCTFCTVSFPGRCADEWDKLVDTSDCGIVSTACVFLREGDERLGEHYNDPEDCWHCYCYRLYGSPKPWGCAWFADWDRNVREAHRRGQKLVVHYLKGHLQEHDADWSCSDTLPQVDGELAWEELAGAAKAGTLWSAESGLCASQRGELAWLKKLGLPFFRLDVGDGAPSSREAIARLVQRGEVQVAAVEAISAPRSTTIQLPGPLPAATLPTALPAFMNLSENGPLALPMPQALKPAPPGPGAISGTVKRMDELKSVQGLLYDLEKFQEAEQLAQRALAASRVVLGAEHPRTRTAINLLAVVLERTARAEDAESLYKKALEISERVVGPEQPETLVYMNNLGMHLKSRGKLEEAEPLLRRHLQALEHALGPDHWQTLVSLDNLALLLKTKGQLGPSEQLYQRALETRERTLGVEHAETLTAVNNLARVLTAKGELKAAEPLLRRALDARERTLGPLHPDTLLSLNNMALFLRKKGKLDSAELLGRRAVERAERRLGKDHPRTLLYSQNLAAVLEAQRECDY